MIIKRNFNLWKVFLQIRTELILASCMSLLCWALKVNYHLILGLPWSVAAILGSALAIFIAFRNQSSYGRWWEARTIWGGIINNTRILARQIIINVDAAIQNGKINKEKGLSYTTEVVHKLMAFAYCLKMHLRQEDNWGVLASYMESSEYNTLLSKENKPNYLLQHLGKRIKDGINQEYLGAFDTISIEPNLASLTNWQGSCERIKNTPLPMNYQFFTKVFLWVFIGVLPFALINDLVKQNASYLLLPATLLISSIFSIMNKVGEINENPFENQMQDIPMNALCNTIERDLKEMLNQKDLPERTKPDINGFLY